MGLAITASRFRHHGVTAQLSGMDTRLGAKRPIVTWQYYLSRYQSLPYGLVMKTDGGLIRRKRIGLGHGVNRFAALAGISGAALSRIENGLRAPRPETLKKITDALGCPINEVIAEEDGVGPTCEVGSAAGNDEGAACEAAPPVERTHEPTQ